jgi:hypothetical protein
MALVAVLALCTCTDGDDRRVRKKPADELQAPTGLTASPGDMRVTITFDTVADATSYNLYHKTSPGVTTADSQIAGIASPFVHVGLVNGTTYHYRVTALRDTEESDLSDEVSATPELVPPDPPTGLLAMAGDGQVTIVHDPVVGATSYNLYYDTEPGVTKANTSILAIPSPFVHAGLTNGTTYYYRVSAVEGVLEGTLSAEVQAIPQGGPPGPPRSVYATGGDADGTITIRFFPGAGAVTHNLYWDTSPGVTTADSKIPGVVNPHDHTGLVNGTTYYYRLTAENPFGESALSSETSAVPLAIPTCSRGWVEINSNRVDFANVTHTYDDTFGIITIEMTDSTPADWSITMRMGGADEDPGIVDSCEQGILVDVVDPLGTTYVENICFRDVIIIFSRYATEVGPPPPGCTKGTFGGVLEEITTGNPWLRLWGGYFEALRQ